MARRFLGLETVAFLGAAGVHAGVLWPGHEHAKAATAETVIGGVLAAGLVRVARPRPGLQPAAR